MRLTIASKLFLSFGVALLFVASLGVASYSSLTQLMDTAGWVTHTYEVLHQLDSISLGTKEEVTAERAYLLTGNARFLQAVRSARGKAAESFKAARSLTQDNPRQQNKLDTLHALLASESGVVDELLERRTQNRLEAGAQLTLIEKSEKLQEGIFKETAGMEEHERTLLNGRNAQASATLRNTRYLLVYGGILSFLCTGLIGFGMQRSIFRLLTEFKDFVTFVGAGDLTRAASVAHNGEVSGLAESLNRMVDGLKDVTGQARSAAQSLNSGVAQILASTRQQAASSSQQAAAVVQASATMQQISQSGFEISDRAKQVSGMAEEASKASNAGLKAVQNTDLSMEAIREQAEAVAEHVVSLSSKTQAVGEIVATVNDIAEQSHLLALNAAIQAAAAGEHGRTFAVVASEIKNLADQSRDATVQVRSILSEIQKAIGTSVMLTEEAVKRVESGKLQAQVAAGTIQGMNSSIQQSVQAFQQIVAGTNQQQIGFEQVTQAFRDIGQASEQTAAGTRQMETAAIHLSALGTQLGLALDRYRI